MGQLRQCRRRWKRLPLEIGAANQGPSHRAPRWRRLRRRSARLSFIEPSPLQRIQLRWGRRKLGRVITLRVPPPISPLGCILLIWSRFFPPLRAALKNETAAPTARRRRLFFFLSFFLSNEPASIGDAHNLIEKIGHFQRIPFKTQSGQSNSKLVPSTRPILSLDVSLALFLRHPEEVWNERDQLKTVQWRVRTPEKRIGPNWNRLDPLGQTTRRKMLVGWCDIPTVNSVVIHIKLIWNDRWLSDSRKASDQYKLVVKMYYRSVNNWITDHQTSYTIPFWLLIHHYLVLK